MKLLAAVLSCCSLSVLVVATEDTHRPCDLPKLLEGQEYLVSINIAPQASLRLGERHQIFS
ncbi:hypothetical protein scyTo_0024268, partial [Scyliorhinus torazame]|nr:hypothetical protein [Scyliorhinus torazame]